MKGNKLETMYVELALHAANGTNIPAIWRILQVIWRVVRVTGMEQLDRVRSL